MSLKTLAAIPAMAFLTACAVTPHMALSSPVLASYFDCVRERGIAGLNRAWESPENLPSLHEIELPEAWLARVAAP